MLSHNTVWKALDTLARNKGLSPSGLAKLSGLNATTFNKSKRLSGNGRPRWPSIESLSRVLAATGTSFSEFTAIIEKLDSPYGYPSSAAATAIPLFGFAEAGRGGFFDENGTPQGEEWDQVMFPDVSRGETVFALEVSGDSMEPLYCDGDIIIVSPSSSVRKKDKIVVRTREGEVMTKILQRRSRDGLLLSSLNTAHEDVFISHKQVDWVARVLWASQ